MENQRFRNSIWLVNQLFNYKKLTLGEINELWLRNVELSGGVEFTRNQLRRAIDSAQDQMGIYIGCNRSDYTYFIEDSHNTKAAELLLSSQAISQVFAHSNSEQLRDRILLDGLPSGHYHLSSILEAMTQGCALELIYQKFADTEPYKCFIEPYCVKLHEQRWYLLARKDHRDHLQVFALDRIQRINILYEVPFTLDPQFDPQAYFAYALGVYAGPELVAEQVLLKVAPFWHKYLVTLPLHSSQRVIDQRSDYSLFAYQLAITPDLINKIVSFGPNLEVLKPDSLRQQVADTIARMHALYQSQE